MTGLNLSKLSAKCLTLAAIILFSGSCNNYSDSLSDYVNPFIGTAAKNDGAVSPFVGRPYAMTKFTAQTRPNGVCLPAYIYEDSTMTGFLASHQPLVACMGDYGYVSVMPQAGRLRTLPYDRRLKIDKSTETAHPYLYSVNLADEQGTIGARMSAASRAGVLEFTFPEGSSPRVIVQGIELDLATENFINDVADRTACLEGTVQINAEAQEITGYNPDRQSHTWGPELPNFKGWFVVRFDTPFTVGGTFNGDADAPGLTEGIGTRCGAWVEFPEGTRKVRVQVGTSFISEEQARKNMKSELKGFDVDRLAAETRRSWDRKLRNLTVENVPDSTKHIFYTAVYHTYMLPREMYEDGFYYSAFDDSVHKGRSYNDYATWDTFRALHPLMTLLEPELTGDWVAALLQMYKEGGWLPKWPNPTYTNVMIGTHADAIISDAIMKGIKGFDVNLAYEAMMKDATVPPDGDTVHTWFDREKTRLYEARGGLTYYRSLGYVPSDKTAESVSRTVEFGVDDWAIAQVAKELGKDQDYAMLLKQSANWKNLYNRETGFLAPRLSDGSWAPFDVDRTFRELWYTVDGSFCEANPWNYLFGAMHDPDGMVELMGRKLFVERLDQVYELGKYNHANEPAHHYDYLYNYTGMPWKTQERVRQDVDEAYFDAPEGMIGNDDCGQMSAWYLLSSMGIYQMAPGSNRFEFGAPQLPVVNMKVNGHTLTFKADNLSKENLYVKEIYVDGKLWEGTSISYWDLVNAREIRYVMQENAAVPASFLATLDVPEMLPEEEYDEFLNIAPFQSLDYFKDVIYKEIDGEALRMQILVPAPRDTLMPCVVYIKGSGWGKQNLYDNLPRVEDLAMRGLVVAIAEYRATPEHIFPAQIEDTKTAVRFMRANYQKYHVDPDNIFLWGDSSGGHTVLMAALTMDEKFVDKGFEYAPCDINGVIAVYAPTDLAVFKDYPTIIDARSANGSIGRLIGCEVPGNEDIALDASPVSYVDRKHPSVPVFMTHGTKDLMVPFNQSEMMVRKLRQFSHEVHWYPVKGAGHAGWEFFSAPMYDRMVNFMQNNIKRTETK